LRRTRQFDNARRIALEIPDGGIELSERYLHGKRIVGRSPTQALVIEELYFPSKRHPMKLLGRRAEKKTPEKQNFREFSKPDSQCKSIGARNGRFPP
jgi:hypothetical protein